MSSAAVVSPTSELSKYHSNCPVAGIAHDVAIVDLDPRQAGQVLYRPVDADQQRAVVENRQRIDILLAQAMIRAHEQSRQGLAWLVNQHVPVGIGQPGGRAVGIQADGNGRLRRRRRKPGRHGQIARDAQRLRRRVAAQVAAQPVNTLPGSGSAVKVSTVPKS